LKYNRAEIMKRAWRIAAELADENRGITKKSCFSAALKMSWSEHKTAMSIYK